MTRARKLLVGAVVGLALLVTVATGVTAGDDGADRASLVDRTEGVDRLVALSNQPQRTAGTGLVFGLGVGLVVGSTATFKYWDSKLS